MRAALLVTLLCWSARAHAAGEEFVIAQLQYPGGAAKLDALAPWLYELEERTSVHVRRDGVGVRAADAATLARYPFLVLSGGETVPSFTDVEIDRLRRHISAGGTLFIDGSEGPGGRFDEAVHRLASALFPEHPMQPVPASHVIFKSFYLIDKPVGRVAEGQLEGIILDGRLAVIYAPFDLLGALTRKNGDWSFQPTPGGDFQREMAFRFAVNIVQYVLCLDYKEDQVHVPFILHRRQWRP
jgi:hypothetical protein